MTNERRVVITGIGITAPSASDCNEFLGLLRGGQSAICTQPEMAERGFQCQVGGVAEVGIAAESDWYDYYDLAEASSFIQLACVAGVEAWRSAGLELLPPDSEAVDWDTAMIVGSGFAGLDAAGNNVVPNTDQNAPKKIGSFGVQHTMGSGAAAMLSTIVGAGGQIAANSSACCTGTEAILDGYYKIQNGLAKRVLAGSVEGYSPYIWAQFEAARVLNRKHNDQPEAASRPLSESARGVAPSSGAGILVLESLESALERGAPIYAELLGGDCNSGGQRGSGSMTFPNNEGVQRCLHTAMQRSGITAEDIDLISGHLTATKADPLEAKNWADALALPRKDFPYLNAPKSIFGHALAGAGALETVACVLQLQHGFIHASLNCEDIHPGVAEHIPPEKIPHEWLEAPWLRTVIKASFGFGDVNACIILRKYEDK